MMGLLQNKIMKLREGKLLIHNVTSSQRNSPIYNLTQNKKEYYSPVQTINS